MRVLFSTKRQWAGHCQILHHFYCTAEYSEINLDIYIYIYIYISYYSVSIKLPVLAYQPPHQVLHLFSTIRSQLIPRIILKRSDPLGPTASPKDSFSKTIVKLTSIVSFDNPLTESTFSTFVFYSVTTHVCALHSLGNDSSKKKKNLSTTLIGSWSFNLNHFLTKSHYLLIYISYFGQWLVVVHSNSLS